MALFLIVVMGVEVVKKYGHAWVALMALKRIDDLGDGFSVRYQKQADRFVEFFGKHRDVFLQGAWFPDDPIGDNLIGGHTWKYAKPRPGKIGNRVRHKTPDHLSMKDLIDDGTRFNEEVVLDSRSHLADRCEALSQAIRDMIFIQEDQAKGSPIMFSDNQIALNFLMLGHYIADAHVPPHCDRRDFYGPPKIHPDMEKFWDKEIEKYYVIDKKKEVFDLDVNGNPELKNPTDNSFKDSILHKALMRLEKRTWNPSHKSVLGKGNKNHWDYTVGVCFVSYLVSTWFIPEASNVEYAKIRILKDDAYKDKLIEMSEHVIADAIDSIALIWLRTWDRTFKLKEEKRGKIKKIKKKQGYYKPN